MSALRPAGPDVGRAVTAEVDGGAEQSRRRQSTALVHRVGRHAMVPRPAGSVDPADVALPGWAADADSRGSLEIAPLVLRRIVERAADEVPGVLHRGRKLGGLEMGDEGPKARVRPAPPPMQAADLTEAEPQASLEVRLDLTLAYPTPVRATVDAVRAKVAADLQRLACYRLDALAVRVVGLHNPVPPRTVPH